MDRAIPWVYGRRHPTRGPHRARWRTCSTRSSTKRPYKPAFPIRKCFDIIQQERGEHFDPAVVDAFMARKDQIVEIQIAYSDE